MMASSGVTRNTVIMYATQGWSLYHRMGRVYYQNIWLQKRQIVWELFGMFKNINIYFTRRDSQRVPMCVLWEGYFCLARLILVAEWDTDAVATSSLSCRWTHPVNKQGSRGKEGSVCASFWWIYSPWKDPDLNSAVKAQVSAVAFLVSFLSAIF